MVFAAVGTWWLRESIPDLNSSPRNFNPDALGVAIASYGKRLAFEANKTTAKFMLQSYLNIP